ncbi:MAG: class I SAM-dependent methyltransferase [Xanthomonadales bacterium]|nr:class I SAM-dependent methyltransferase [Xanthomonadales bacterium]
MKPPVFRSDWPDDVKALYRHDVQEIWDQRIAPQIWTSYHNQLDMYLAIAGSKPLSILDVGCAQGTLALLLAERGHSVTAVDLRPQFLSYAQSRQTHGDIAFRTIDVLTDPIPGRYDLVFANQIIEHLVYPTRLCRRLFDVLVPGGRIVITTPSWHYVRNSLPNLASLGDPSRWEHLQNSADGDGHFYAYTVDELAQSVAEAGFADVSVESYETPVISGHMKVRYLQRLLPYRVLQRIDRLLLAMPFAGRRLGYQLLCTGVRPGAGS